MIERWHNQEIVKALNKLEKGLGAKFYNRFKTITFDNRLEFKDYKSLERSYRRKT